MTSPTRFEKEQTRETRQLAKTQAKLEALEASLPSVKGTHRAALRTLQKELEQKHQSLIKSIERNTYELEWESKVLQPLALHIQHLGEAWTGQDYSDAAQQYMSKLPGLTDKMITVYKDALPVGKAQRMVAAFIDQAPLTLGEPAVPTHYYPYADQRMKVAQTTWEEALEEMRSAKNALQYQDGLYPFTGYLDMHASLVNAVAAVLDGDEQKIDKAVRGRGVDKKQLKALWTFFDFINEEDAHYDLDKNAKKALQRAGQLEQRLAPAPQTPKGPRRF